MGIFEKASAPENEYLKKYTDMATRFQNVGIGIVAASVLLNLVTRGSLGAANLALFAIGAIPLVYGGASLRPHNLIKAFAQQCSREPGDTIARGLLEAIERNPRTRLTKGSLNMVFQGIESYALLEDSDQELAQKLRDTAASHLVKSIL